MRWIYHVRNWSKVNQMEVKADFGVFSVICFVDILQLCGELGMFLPHNLPCLALPICHLPGELSILPILDLVWRAGLLSASDSVLALLLYIWQSLPCILAFAHPSSCHLPRELVSAHSRPRPESWACFWRRRGRLSLLFLAHSCVRQQLLAHHSGTQVNASLPTKRCTFFYILGAF